jgi:hypothetical protein
MTLNPARVRRGSQQNIKNLTMFPQVCLWLLTLFYLSPLISYIIPHKGVDFTDHGYRFYKIKMDVVVKL